MQILSDCDANLEYSGAAIVAIVFLVVFVLLIFIDTILTAFALYRTLTKIDGQDLQIQKLQAELMELRQQRPTFKTTSSLVSCHKR